MSGTDSYGIFPDKRSICAEAVDTASVDIIARIGHEDTPVGVYEYAGRRSHLFDSLDNPVIG